MKTTNKILLFIITAILLFFVINETSNYFKNLENKKQELYNKNQTIYKTIKNLQNENIKSLAIILSNDQVIKKAYIEDNPKILQSHLQQFWKKVKSEKLVHEIHFFKPPAESFVNFSNFKSIGKDVSDARMDIVLVTSTFKSSLHAMMCKTYAGLRATFPIIDEDGVILGGLSMGKKIDWLPRNLKEITKSDAFLVYDKDSTHSLVPKYYKYFMKDKKILGNLILANKTITITDAEFKKINFTKSIQDITINNHQYSLNIFQILDFEKKDLAYVCVLNDLEEYTSKYRDLLIKDIFLLLIFSLLIYFLLRNRTIELEYEKNYIQKLLNLTPDLTLVTNGNKLLSANQRFFEFVEYDTIEDFLKDHDCICDYFVSVDGKAFSNDKTIENEIWSIHIANQIETLHSAILEKNGELYHFNINSVYINDKEVLITLQNITEMKRKDQLLYEQSKMASMGEMIGNIAHQWRQPLSIISTAATGMKVQKEFNTLDDKNFYATCDTINENTQYLSKTIDDFRNFIIGDRKKSEFNLEENIKSFLQLIDGTKKSHNINIILEIEKNIKINGYQHELSQCLINIFNNAKDAFSTVNYDKLVFVKTKIDSTSIQIIIEDNAGGIDDDVLTKIFDPYFTTKHQSQGTGLGLHMTYKLIVEGMKGTIKANNINFKYQDKDYKGAQFIITLKR